MYRIHQQIKKETGLTAKSEPVSNTTKGSREPYPDFPDYNKGKAKRQDINKIQPSEGRRSYQEGNVRANGIRTESEGIP